MSRLFHTGSASHAKHFDIRLDDDYVVLRGSAEEAASAHLKGVVVLCLAEPLAVKDVKLHLTGLSHISYPFVSGAIGPQRRCVRENTFLQQTWTFRDAGKGKTETMPADNYEFPFDIVLQGSLPESLEGLEQTWITYRFKAEIRRKYAKNITIRKPFRVIRTLDPTDLELSHMMAIENVWPDKMEYLISTPNKAVIFGTSIKVNFKLVPLLKGLRIGQITSQLLEATDLLLRPPSESEPHPRPHKSTKVVMTDSFEVDSEHSLEVLNDVVEGYHFTRSFDLPKSLSKCVQDINVKGIKIRHKLRFRVQLHNPDGHISELRANLPIAIFISPHLPLDNDNNLVERSTLPAQRAAFSLAQETPPVYGEHMFDQLYSEVDPSGYATPPQLSSGPSTPLGPHSRNMSMENLASVVDEGDLSASALLNRLNHLHYHSNGSSAPETPPPESSNHPDDRTASRPTSAVDWPSPLAMVLGANNNNNTDDADVPELCRHPSDDDNLPSGVATPHPHCSQIEDLTRVPSYCTAVRSSVPAQYDTDLPNYQSATAGDPTPCNLPSAPGTHTTTQRPNRSSASSSVSSSSSSAPTANRPGFRRRHHSYNQDHGTDNWLRIMQARART